MIYRAVMTSSHGPSVFRGQTILSIIIYQGCFPGTANTTFFTFGPKNRQFFFSQNKLDLFCQYLQVSNLQQMQKFFFVIITHSCFKENIWNGARIVLG